MGTSTGLPIRCYTQTEEYLLNSRVSGQNGSFPDLAMETQHSLAAP